MNRSFSITKVLAFVLPALMLVLAFRHLARPDSGLLDKRAQGIQKRLNDAPPTVAVVGNSLARDDVDGKQLSKALDKAGFPAEVVAKLAVGGTPPPVWYAMLKHHVFGQGHTPDAIVVVGTLESFFWSQVSTVGETQRLRELVGTNDAEILQKATGRSVVIPALERAETRKVALRDELLESWAEQVIAVSGSGTDGSENGANADARAAARAEIDAAFASLFESDGAIDMRLHKRVIPVMQDQAGLEHEEDDRPLVDTFLPLFHQLAVAQGARLVFVRVPLSTHRAHHDPDDRLEEMIEWANANSIGFVDLSSMAVEERHFRDGKHLNKRGRTLFTAELAAALVSLGAFGDGPLEEASAPLADAIVGRGGPVPKLESVDVSRMEAMEGCVRTVNRPDLAPYGQGPLARKRLWNASPLRVRIDGTVQPLVAGRVLKKECKGVALNGDKLMVAGLTGTIEVMLESGAPLSKEGGRDVYWVYPDSPLTIELGEARQQALADSGNPIDFDVVVQPLRQGAAPVTVSFDGGEAQPLGTRRGRLVESVLSPNGVPKALAVSSDDPAVVRLVRLRSGSLTEVLVGDLDRAGESLVRMIEGGNTDVTFESTPPTLDTQPPKTVGSELVWTVPELKHINNSAVYRASDKFNCTPVRVFNAGQVAPFAYVGCNSMKPGAICFDGPKVRIQPKVLTAGAEYTLGLEPSRQCRTWTYVYGGDTLRFTLNDTKLSKLLTDVEQLELMAEILPPADTKLVDEYWTLSLHAKDGRLVKRRLKVKDFAASIQRFRLNKGRGQKELTLTLEADPGAPPLILGYVLLRERALSGVPPSAEDIKGLKQRIRAVGIKGKKASEKVSGKAAGSAPQ